MFFSHGGEKGGGEVCGEKGRMDLEKYGAVPSADFLSFTFESVGPNGRIKKLVKFQPMYGPIYNIALSDVDEFTGELSDTAVSNNNDTRKILTTVVATIYDFFKSHQDALLFIKGNTHSRTRLFRRAITIYFDKISADFAVYGQMDGAWELFVSGEDYSAFLFHPN